MTCFRRNLLERNQNTTVPANQEKMLVVTGGQLENGTHSKECWFYDASNTFQKLCTMTPESAELYSACATRTGFILTGGKNSTMCIRYDIPNRCWRQGLQPLRTSRHSYGSVFFKGKIYVLGGKVEEQLSKSVDYFCLIEKEWKAGPELPFVVQHPGVGLTCVKNHILLVYNNKVVQLVNSTWTNLLPMPLLPLIDDQEVESENSAGQGQRNSGAWRYSGQSIDQYDFRTGKWSSLRIPLPCKMTNCHAFVLDLKGWS